MAIRFDAAADALTRVANLPTINAFTLMGWFYLTADRNAYTTFFQFGDATAESAVRQLETADNGTTLTVWNGATEKSGSSLSIGQWYHLALVCDGTGDDKLRAYKNGVLDISTKGNTDVDAAEKLWVGNSIGGEWLNGRAAALKAWSAALTQAEIQTEMYHVLPTRITNLVGWWPCFPGAVERLADYGPSGYNWTAGGTLTDEDGPPITWRHTYAQPFVQEAGAEAVALAGAAAGIATVTAGLLVTYPWPAFQGVLRVDQRRILYAAPRRTLEPEERETLCVAPRRTLEPDARKNIQVRDGRK